MAASSLRSKIRNFPDDGALEREAVGMFPSPTFIGGQRSVIEEFAIVVKSLAIPVVIMTVTGHKQKEK